MKHIQNIGNLRTFWNSWPKLIMRQNLRGKFEFNTPKMMFLVKEGMTDGPTTGFQCHVGYLSSTRKGCFLEKRFSQHVLYLPFASIGIRVSAVQGDTGGRGLGFG